MTALSPAYRRLATTLACVAATALVTRPVDAQWGKIKDLGKAAVKGAVEGTAEGAAKKAVGGGQAGGAPLRASNVKFTDDVLEITDARIAQLLRGLDAEAAAKPGAEQKFLAQRAASEELERTYPAREAAWKKEHAAWTAREAARERCVNAAMSKQEGAIEREMQASQTAADEVKGEFASGDKQKRMKALGERMQAAQARGDQKAVAAMADTLQREMAGIMRMGTAGAASAQRLTAVSNTMTADAKKCGAPVEEPPRPEQGGFADPSGARREVKSAGVKASGLEERQYDVLRERVETYVRLGGRDGGSYIFAAGELATLAKHADALGKRADISEEQYWTPGEKAAR